MLGTFHLSRQSQRGIPRRAKIIYTLLFTEEYSERCARYPTVQSQNYILQNLPGVVQARLQHRQHLLPIHLKTPKR
jgi:hypothetical protein